MSNLRKTAFVPVLIIPSNTTDIDFYEKAFGAIELRRWSNDDGSIHVAELEIDGAMFHLHEENITKGRFSPAVYDGVTTEIGLMVADVDAVMKKASAVGAKQINPATDYDYGYRQGDISDPFGHRWTIEMVI